MNICYSLLREKTLSQSRQTLERLKLHIAQHQELVIKKNRRSILNSLEKGSILAVEDLEQLGSSFCDTLNNLNSLVERKITLVCLNSEEVFDACCPEYSFFSRLYHLKLAENEKTRKVRLDTIKRNNSKPGRHSVYNQEVEIMISSLQNATDLTVDQICRRVNISKTTYYNYYKKKEKVNPRD